jgi:hypothetical protein
MLELLGSPIHGQLKHWQFVVLACAKWSNSIVDIVGKLLAISLRLSTNNLCPRDWHLSWAVQLGLRFLGPDRSQDGSARSPFFFRDG